MDLRKMRQERGLLGGFVAGAIGVSQSTLYAWETGERNPRPDSLAMLVAFYEKFPVLAKKTKEEPPAKEERCTQAHSICWDCAHSVSNGCSWSSKSRKPVDGWQAKTIHMRCGLTSYEVKSCPEFVRG